MKEFANEDENHATITLLLEKASGGDAVATEEVWNQLYSEIHKIAKGFSGNENVSPTLQPSMLVNEAFIKLFGGSIPDWNNRQHFLNSAAKAMGRFLIDRSRSKKSVKRGGAQSQVPLTVAVGEVSEFEVAHSYQGSIAIDALEALDKESPYAAEIARLRFVLGLSVEQAANISGLAPRTVKKKWSYAKAWMRKYISDENKNTTNA